MLRPLVVALAVLPMGAARVTARAIENWPYDRLFKEADLIIIAEATATTDTCEILEVPGWTAKFYGVNTKFAVKHVLKGSSDAESVTVFHLRLDKDVQIKNGPLLITFRTKSGTIPLKEGKPGIHKLEYVL